MTAYQAGIAKFEGVETQVFGISTDNVPTLKHFAEELKLGFPLLSDFSTRKTATAYGILLPSGVANRATFVVGLDGKIEHIEEGSGAIDPTGAETACKRVRNKT
jgi:peroxiredoxin